MTSGLEDYITDIAQTVSQDLGGVLDVSTARWVSPPTGKPAVKDTTLAFFVDGHKSHDDIALLISNPSFPTTVADDVTRAKNVAALVDQNVKKHIISPLNQGVYQTQTYAAYFRLTPISPYKLPRLIQKKMVSRHVVRWLEQLGVQTRKNRPDTSEYPAYFCDPLEIISGDQKMPQDIKAFADFCGRFVSEKQPELFTVVEHGDFWMGNILFKKMPLPNLNPVPGEFSVIDWRGSRTDGYPCIDLVRFLSSTHRNGTSQTNALISGYIESLVISKLEMSIYCILSLGRLKANLDQFPEEKFYMLCENVFLFLQAHNLTNVE